MLQILFYNLPPVLLEATVANTSHRPGRLCLPFFFREVKNMRDIQENILMGRQQERMPFEMLMAKNTNIVLDKTI